MVTSLPALAEIRSLEEALHRPEIRANRAAVESLLAEAFVEIGASGRFYERSMAVDAMTQEAGGEGEDHQLESFNYVLQPIADNAVLLTYETKRSDGTGAVRCVLRSSIWKHDGLKWQMLFHQGTIRP